MTNERDSVTVVSSVDFGQISQHWNDSGLVVIPGFLDRQEIADLRRICDNVLRQAIAEAPDRANASNIAYLTEPRYFHSRDADLLRLLEFVADQRIVALLTHLAGEFPLFHNTQYFHNPATLSWDGDWHRDTQFLAPEVALEQERMKYHTGVHFRVAFVACGIRWYLAGRIPNSNMFPARSDAGIYPTNWIFAKALSRAVPICRVVER